MVSGEWPYAELRPFAPAELAQVFAKKLAAVADELSLREIARVCELDAMTVRALLRGDRYPDMLSVSKLEAGFDELLWPTDEERRVILDRSGEATFASSPADRKPERNARVLVRADDTDQAGRPSKVHLSARIEAELDQWLRRRAVRRDTSVTQVVQDLLRAARLVDPDDPPVEH